MSYHPLGHSVDKQTNVQRHCHVEKGKSDSNSEDSWRGLEFRNFLIELSLQDCKHAVNNEEGEGSDKAASESEVSDINMK